MIQTLKWNRTALIKETRERIWTYLSPASRFEMRELLVATALLQWPPEQASRIGELQFLFCQETRDFVNCLPQLTRHLATTSAREEETSNERLRGPVNWSQTISAQARSGSRHTYVTAPAERGYRTPENELLVHVLDAFISAARASGWLNSTSKQDAARLVQTLLTEAERWQQSRMLSGVKRVPPTPRSLSRIKSGRVRDRYAPVLDAYNKLVSLVERPDLDSIRAAIEEIGLVTADDSILFQLLVTFQTIDSLNAHGWQLKPFYLFDGKVHTYGRQSDGRRLDLWYQSDLGTFGQKSKYRDILHQHGFTRQPDLRPDLLLSWTDQGGQTRRLVVECKLSKRNGTKHAARRALVDILAYREASSATLADTGLPYGLGVAWGAGLRPCLASEAMLCTPDAIREAMAVTVA